MKKALGKGLGALIGDAPSQSNPSAFQQIDIQLIDTDLNQPRKHFDEEKLEELSQSIRTHGVMQPLLLAKNGERYTIIAGERRYRAARLAGLSALPAIIRELSEQDTLEVSLIENIQREDLNALEQASALQALMEQYNLTQAEVSKRVGKSRSAIANLTRLIALPDEIKALLQKGSLSAGHARALLPLSDEARMIAAAQLIISRDFSVRQTEEYVRRLLADKTAAVKNPRPKASPELLDAQRTLSERLDTRVVFSGDEQNGKIILEYYSKEQLSALYGKLLG